MASVESMTGRTHLAYSGLDKTVGSKRPLFCVQVLARGFFWGLENLQESETQNTARMKGCFF
jgi:hypothetical protein